MRRTPLKRGQKGLKRTEMKRGKPLARGKPLESRTRLRSRPKDHRYAPVKATRRWRRNVLRRCHRDPDTKLYVCPACGEQFEPGWMECHHIIEQERIKKYVDSLLLIAELKIEVMVRRLWDPRNGIAVCRDCHAAHTNRKRPLARELLPECVYGFANEIGLGYVLDRYYA